MYSGSARNCLLGKERHSNGTSNQTVTVCYSIKHVAPTIPHYSSLDFIAFIHFSVGVTECTATTHNREMDRESKGLNTHVVMLLVPLLFQKDGAEREEEEEEGLDPPGDP